MRKQLVILVIVAQLGVLAYMAAKRETIHRFGTEVTLRTAPIDPRDPFRGDFVRLQYPMGMVSRAQWRGSEIDKTIERGTAVFASLRPTAEGRYALDYLSDQRPAQGVFIKGRTSHATTFRHPQLLNVRYGIEQYFVEQGRGRDIEQTRGHRNGLQVPMEMDVAIGGDGTAVLRGYRWSRLGIELEMLRVPRPLRPNEPVDPLEPRSPKVRVTLLNVSKRSLSVANLAPHCGFVLRTVHWSPQEYLPADTDCLTVKARATDLISLAPQQSFSVELDFSMPRWYALIDEQAQEIGAQTSLTQFRVVYVAPETGTIPGAHDADLWLGELPTRSFNASGRID